jgi:hypothetical protein
VLQVLKILRRSSLHDPIYNSFDCQIMVVTLPKLIARASTNFSCT